MKKLDLVLMKELGEVLNRHGNLAGSFEVEHSDKGLLIAVIVPPTGVSVESELYNELEYLHGVSQIRGFAAKYDITEDLLREFLPQKEGK